jgi:hypothetical protein
MGFRLVAISAAQILAGQLPGGVTIPVSQVTSGVVSGLFTVGTPGGKRIDIDGSSNKLTMYDATNAATIVQDPATQSIVIGKTGTPKITMNTTNLVQVAGIAVPGAQEVLATGSATETVPGALSSGSSGGATDQGLVVVSSPIFSPTSGALLGVKSYGTLNLFTAAKDSSSSAEATLAVIGGYPVGVAASSITCRYDGSIVLNGFPVSSLGDLLMGDGLGVRVGSASAVASFASGRAAGTDDAVSVRIAGDANSRWVVTSNGKHFWGPGGGVAVDTTLDRQAARVLGINGAFVGAGETWHAPTYSGTWTGSTVFNSTLAALQTLQYRQDAEDNLWLVGCFKAGAGPTNPILVLPVGWRPTTSQLVPAMEAPAAGGATLQGTLFVSSSGNVSIFGGNANLTLVASNTYFVNAKIPLGNIT